MLLENRQDILILLRRPKIGTHAFNMAEYVSGLKVTKICADLNIVVKGRKPDDDGAVLMKFDNDATGVLFASQIAAGDENNIRIRVYGEKGGLTGRGASVRPATGR